MSALIFTDFKPTKIYFEKLEQIKIHPAGKELNIILKKNTGGSILAGDHLLEALLNCKANITLLLDESAESTGAFVWMKIHLEKCKGSYKNVCLKLSTDQQAAHIMFHRPIVTKQGKDYHIEDLTCKHEFSKMKPWVEKFDNILCDFLNTNPNIISMPKGGESRYYSPQEIFKLYINNVDIIILIKGQHL